MPGMAFDMRFYYDYATTKDLRQFIKQRTGQQLANMDRLCYIQHLRDLDENWRFRFVELPPEIRNLVYSELLRLRSSELRAGLQAYFPQILSTCKVIHQEAQDLLYSENAFEIRIQSMAYLQSKDSPRNRTRIGFTELETDDVIFRDASMAEIDGAWPAYIRKAESIRLVVYMDRAEVDDEGPVPTSFYQLNHVLHSLGSAKDVAANVKRLEVVVKRYPPDMDEDILRSIFYPIAVQKHGTSSRLDVEGLQTETVRYLKDAANEHSSRSAHCSIQDVRIERRRAIQLYSRAMAAGLRALVLSQLAVFARQAGSCLNLDEIYLDEGSYAHCEEVRARLLACLDDPAMQELIGELEAIEEKARQERA